jgi:hypothetical protein
MNTERVVFNCDYEHSVLGVPGRFKALTRKPGQAPELWFKQTWRSFSRPVRGYGTDGKMSVEIRFDDECGNRKNSFAITAEVTTRESLRRGDIQAGGCMHDEIQKVFPELAPLIKWHLVDTAGPMHYVANTCYHASNLANGYAAGEVCRWEKKIKFGNFPILYNCGKFGEWVAAVIQHRRDTLESNPNRRDFEIVEVPYIQTKPGDYDFSPKYSFDDFASKWHECPFNSREEAEQFREAIKWGFEIVRIPVEWSKGKERDLEAARRCANWPEATDEQLCLPRAELEALLLARVPAMMAEFKQAIESIGFFWSPAEYLE